MGGEVLDVGGVAELGAGADRADLDDAGEDVGERQEQQRRGTLGLEQLRQELGGATELGAEVAVGEPASLGSARGAGRVDQGREGGAGEGGAARLELGVADLAAALRDVVHGAGVDAPHLPEVVDVRPRLVDALPVHVGLHDRGDGSGILQDPGDLRDRRRLVDRHGCRTDPPDRVVRDGPLVARLRQEDDPVAGGDARRHQTLGERRPRARGTRRASRPARCRRAVVRGRCRNCAREVDRGRPATDFPDRSRRAQSRTAGYRHVHPASSPVRLAQRLALAWSLTASRTRRGDGADCERHRHRCTGRSNHGRHRRLRRLSRLGHRREDRRRRRGFRRRPRRAGALRPGCRADP